MMICSNGFTIFNKYSKKVFTVFFSLSMMPQEIYEHIADFLKEGFMFQTRIIVLIWHDAQENLWLLSL